jgi:hypothetical protein
MTRAAVESVATGSVPNTNTPACTGVPSMGPLPSIPTIPSTIWRSGRIAEATSMTASCRPAQCRTFFGQP